MEKPCKVNSLQSKFLYELQQMPKQNIEQKPDSKSNFHGDQQIINKIQTKQLKSRQDEKEDYENDQYLDIYPNIHYLYSQTKKYYCGKCRLSFKKKQSFIDHIFVCGSFFDPDSSHFILNQTKFNDVHWDQLMKLKDFQQHYPNSYLTYAEDSKKVICGCGETKISGLSYHINNYHAGTIPKGTSRFFIKYKIPKIRTHVFILLPIKPKPENEKYTFVCPCKPQKKLYYRAFANHIIKRHHSKSPLFYMRKNMIELKCRTNWIQTNLNKKNFFVNQLSFKLIGHLNLLYKTYKELGHIMQKEQESDFRTVKIYATSDTHDKHQTFELDELPEADIFIHAGDFTKYSRKSQLQRFKNFLRKLPYKHKIVIAGNHDFALDKERYQNQLKNTKHKDAPLNSEQEIKSLKECCTYLEHEMVEVQGLRIFGSPYSPEFFDWGFMYAPEQGEQIWKSIPQNIDVLITHGPPYGILDYTNRKVNAGCKGLLKFVQKMKPKVHIFGHIHEDFGKKRVGDTDFYNASYVNIYYKAMNEPWLIEMKVKNTKNIEQK